MNVFISGNRSITSIPIPVLIAMEIILDDFTNEHILVGDADGVDKLVQEIFYIPKTIYYSGKQPRNALIKPSDRHEEATLKHIPASGYGRAWHTHKDIAMSNDCDIHIGLVEHLGNSGTMANHLRVKGMGKPSFIINVNTAKIED